MAIKTFVWEINLSTLTSSKGKVCQLSSQNDKATFDRWIWWVLLYLCQGGRREGGIKDYSSLEFLLNNIFRVWVHQKRRATLGLRNESEVAPVLPQRFCLKYQIMPKASLLKHVDGTPNNLIPCFVPDIFAYYCRSWKQADQNAVAELLQWAATDSTLEENSCLCHDQSYKITEISS